MQYKQNKNFNIKGSKLNVLENFIILMFLSQICSKNKQIEVIKCLINP